MIQVTPGQQIKPLVSPRGGPVDGEVTLTIVGAEPLMPLRIGFGSFGMYELIGREQADAEGSFSMNIRVPYWAERDRVHFFFLSFGRARPRALSDPFHVTAPDGTARIVGTIRDEPGTCLSLAGPDDTVYSLEGPASGWSPGMRVLVTGTIAREPTCGGDAVPIEVARIQPA
jgi:hypothetical protein